MTRMTVIIWSSNEGNEQQGPRRRKKITLIVYAITWLLNIAFFFGCLHYFREDRLIVGSYKEPFYIGIAIISAWDLYIIWVILSWAE